jgi:hypothetical protein
MSVPELVCTSSKGGGCSAHQTSYKEVWHHKLQTASCRKSRQSLHEVRLQSSWTHLITPNRNFMEVRWRSLFRSTFLGKRCTSYNVPPTSRKRAADCWSLRNFLPQSSLVMDGKAQKSHGARSGLYGGRSNGVPPIHFFEAENRIQFRSRHMRFLSFSNHEKGAPRQEIRSDQRSATRFREVGGAL